MKDLENEDKLVKYSEHYSEEKFTDKLLKVARKAGVKVIYAVFLLYYALSDSTFPAKERLLILGALGYFILPVDLIPDAIPFLGFSDDLIALVFAVRRVYIHITPEIKEKARAQVLSIFGKVEEKDFDLF
ncbi:uncharacterized membrane protein YkvA (DUF1232 family) [Parabacteroides sp. PF5-5]|uniref:YkvA family protein n=1 Tax=unclassified Parabacteroides TaxID=2649774 RepID=UPI0024754301|nr:MULTISPECIES: YkvA family protein [unclassified Parabacteroides]MDH6305726.1 uncharacterized membrane protein YkvA (DUF1232 family) [Parabacteroides sp. PH5-39]MDH6316798.1 uncharacterized membrane protein YkvA (DUF1232 family) [Parabacteroides sp. PF5-13]MDH6320439.1 uncharacterized membrane protein YkvA (DUF1232 family) [Parabacteroides sp. PH5-13]MDH6324169.1 uncharacterized membrane protein YkvA (DUF1232 family) [Parabacteroides sp. PH5-8]MDH6327984.1 uncharacterized membrane protein Yk